MADRVFEDRVGLWVIDPANLPDRLPRIVAFAGGLVRDLFLPLSSTAADVQRVRAAGLGCHLWTATDGLDASTFASRALGAMSRLNRAAAELNFEGIPDAQLPTYVRQTVANMRAVRPFARLRLNQPPWKGFGLPVDLLRSDANLYACAQNYLGNMDELLSAADVVHDLLAHGVPPGKATVCYAAACEVLGSSSRLRTLPDLSRLRRGLIFQDDLMVDAGLL